MDGVTAVHKAYRAPYRRLVGQVYALTGSLSEAQDVVHDAYARALARPARFLALNDPETSTHHRKHQRPLTSKNADQGPLSLILWSPAESSPLR